MVAPRPLQFYVYLCSGFVFRNGTQILRNCRLGKEKGVIE